MDDAAKRTQALEASAKSVYESTRTPLEKYHAAVDKLNVLKARGLINTQTYNRAVKQEQQTANDAGAGITTLASSKLFLINATKKVASALVDMAEKGAASVVTTYKLARSVDSTARGFNTLQQGIKMMGGDGEKTSVVLGSLSAKIQDAASGGTASADIFNRLGVSAEELSGLKTDEAFGRVAVAFGKIDDSGKRAALASQLFGEEARDVIALLSQGEAGMGAAAAQADTLGLAFDDLDGSRMEEAASKMGMIQDAVKGVAQKIAISLLPAFEMAADALSDIGINGKSVGDALGSALKYTVYAVALVVDGTRALDVGWKFMVLGMTAGIYLVIKGIQKLLEQLAKLPKRLGGGDVFKGYAANAGIMADSIKDDMREQIGGIDKVIGKGSALRDAINTFDNIGASSEAAASKIKNVKDAMGALPKVNKLGPIFQEGLKVIEANQSPMQRFTSEMGKLDVMLKNGAITWETYARASAGALSNLEQANGLNNFNLAGAQGKNSVEAYKTVTQYQANLNNRESPQQRVQRVLEESKLIEAKQLEAMKKIADHLVKAPEVAKF